MVGHIRYRIMSNKRNPIIDPDQPVIYEIRIKGHLDHQWTDWFGGLTITLEEDGDTLLTGPVVDQAALHGLLKKCGIWECHWSRSFKSNLLKPIHNVR